MKPCLHSYEKFYALTTESASHAMEKAKNSKNRPNIGDLCHKVFTSLDLHMSNNCQEQTFIPFMITGAWVLLYEYV